MQIVFRPNHDRPPKKFKPPLEKVNNSEAKESKELEMEETPKAKVGFVVEQDNAQEQTEQLAEKSVAENEPQEAPESMAVEKDFPVYPECKPGWPGGKPGHPGKDPYYGCPEYPEYPSYPDYPDDDYCPNPEPDGPEQRPDHVCRPYPFPGKYYPLQCLGYAYIPWQTFQRQYQPQEALQRGTLFPELYSPYYPERRPPVIPRPYCNMWQCPGMMRKKKR